MMLVKRGDWEVYAYSYRLAGVGWHPSRPPHHKPIGDSPREVGL